MILMFSVTSCVSAVSVDALCHGTAKATTEHAAALSESPHVPSIRTGAFLIQQLDAGCGRA